MKNKIANISEEKLAEIKRLEAEMNVVLVAYEKTGDKKEK